MKNLSTKKIVLYSISLLSSIMLIVGLAFKVVAYDLGLGKAGAVAASAAGYTVNGFAMFGFAFPGALKLMLLNCVSESFCNLIGVFMGILSIITILLALLSIIYYVYAFFKKDLEIAQKKMKLFFMLGIVLCVLYSVLTIIFIISANKGLDEWYAALAEYGGTSSHPDSFKTSVFISLIIQTVLFLSFMLCKTKIKDMSVSLTKKSTDEIVVKKDNKEIDVDIDIDGILTAELSVIELLNEYKLLYDDAVIGSADYMDKKVKIMKASEKKTKQTLQGVVNKISLEKWVRAELTVTKILRQYKELLQNGVISDADYMEKKVSLLTYIIN